MEPELAKNVRIFEHDKPSNTPVLSLEIAPGLTVSLTEPLGILAVVRREEDGSNKPCIFRWSVSSDVWGPSGYILFQHTANGLKKVEGKHRPPPETLELRERDAEFEELLPGQYLKRNLGDLPPFWDQLVAGEKYELFWPGANMPYRTGAPSVGMWATKSARTSGYLALLSLEGSVPPSLL